jgi:TolA-binding protein
MMVYAIKQKLLDAPSAGTPNAGGKKAATAASAATTSSDILPTFDLIASETPAVKADVEDKSPANTVVGAPILVEVVYPWIAKSPESTLEVFAQTSTGRSKKAPAAGVAFDIEVPGTISLKAKPGNASASGALPAGAAKLLVEKSTAGLGKSALDEGRFGISIPTGLADCPDHTLVAGESAIKRDSSVLAIKPDDSIFVGVRFKDREGKTHWLTRELKQSGLATLDVLDRKMEETITALHIGEVVYLRVLDFMADKSENKDNITVELKTASGATSKVELSETFGHSGIFQGMVRFAYADEVAADSNAGVAVRHGDSVTLTYSPDSKAAAQTRTITIHKGSNGDMAGFTKRFADPSIAVRTQFAIAESYFELAKRQRDQAAEFKKASKEEQAQAAASLARRQIAMGKKILDEVVHDYPDSDIQLQTDYLRGNLELEYAADDQDVNERMKRYNDALTLFAGILANHQDSEYAPKAQFKKALCYERMGNIEKACEEYVRLSYRWPESELVAETIARLGKHFITMAKDSKTKGDALTKEDALKGGEQLLLAYKQYNTAGEVLLRLKRRFPQNSLAARATLTAGTAFILGKEFERAALAFMEIYKDEQLNDPNAKAEAMFRAGQNYLQMGAAATTGKAATGAPKPGRPADPGVEAYKVLTQLTWDFPDSVWAKHARGLLNSEPQLTNVAKSIGQ